MVKCAMVGCTGQVIGGFQKVIAAGTTDDPTATLDGLKRAWCAAHEQALRQGLGRGRFLTREELK